VRTVARAARPFLIAGILVAVVATAFAAVRNEDDPNDTRGVLDVRTARFEWAEGSAPRWTVVTFSTWTEAFLWDRGYLFIELDTHAGPEADEYVLIRSDGRRMVGALFRVGSVRDQLIRAVPVRRANRISVEAAIPWKHLSIGPSRDTIGWWVRTSSSGDLCVKPCLDRAPDDGAFDEWVPGASPDPEPSDPGP
jgi:hypothetical protein